MPQQCNRISVVVNFNNYTPKAHTRHELELLQPKGGGGAVCVTAVLVLQGFIHMEFQSMLQTVDRVELLLAG